MPLQMLLVVVWWRQIKSFRYLNWLLIIALICCVVAILVLLQAVNSKNRIGVERFSRGIDDFIAQGTVDQEVRLFCELFEADTILLVDKADLTGFEYAYLTPNCAKKVKAQVDKRGSELLAFWLVDNARVVACREIESTVDIRLIQNYFSGRDGVAFVLGKVEDSGEIYITIK